LRRHFSAKKSVFGKMEKVLRAFSWTLEDVNQRRKFLRNRSDSDSADKIGTAPVFFCRKNESIGERHMIIMIIRYALPRESFVNNDIMKRIFLGGA
jgi:hypothetical protein